MSCLFFSTPIHIHFVLYHYSIFTFSNVIRYVTKICISFRYIHYIRISDSILGEFDSRTIGGLNNADDGVEARDRWRMIGSPKGDLPALLPPASNSEFAPRMDAVPDIGEHTDAILESLGYTAAEIATLHAEAAV